MTGKHRREKPEKAPGQHRGDRKKGPATKEGKHSKKKEKKDE